MPCSLAAVAVLPCCALLLDRRRTLPHEAWLCLLCSPPSPHPCTLDAVTPPARCRAPRCRGRREHSTVVPSSMPLGGDKSRLDATFCSPSSTCSLISLALPLSLNSPRSRATTAVVAAVDGEFPRPNPRPPAGSPRRPLHPHPRNRRWRLRIELGIRIPFSLQPLPCEQARG